MSTPVDLIKEKINLVEFLRNYIDLTPTGRNFKALCPFHQEKTPSFFVSPDKKIWHCFGCGLGGDAIKFVMLYEHLEFPEALRFLGEKVGVEVSRLSQKEQKEFDILYDIHHKATEFYKENLKKNHLALEYLRSRGLNEETIAEFEIGFAPQGEELTKYLLKNKYSLDYILKSGLAQKTSTGLYRDKFQNRIIFPITNHTGKVIAFTGRILPVGGKDPENVPKYLNSPETLIFNKSKTLYGMGKTKQFIYEKREVIIVEGQLDLLMMWQSGWKNVVAVSGTGLTEEHLLRLRKIADRVIVSFDKDKAGIKALERSLGYFYKFDFFVKVLNLGKYKDPALACLLDKNFVSQQLEKAQPALEYLIDIYVKNDFKEFKEKDILLKKKIVRHILRLISGLQSSVEKGVWLEKLSLKTGLSESDLREELNSLKEVWGEKQEEIELTAKKESEDFYWELVRKLYILSLTEENFSSIIKNELSNFSPTIGEFIENKLKKEQNVLELEADYIKSSFDKKVIAKEFKDILKKVKIEDIKRRIDSLKKEIKEAEQNNDENRLERLVKEFNQWRIEIDKLKNVD